MEGLIFGILRCVSFPVVAESPWFSLVLVAHSLFSPSQQKNKLLFLFWFCGVDTVVVL